MSEAQPYFLDRNSLTNTEKTNFQIRKDIALATGKLATDTEVIQIAKVVHSILMHACMGELDAAKQKVQQLKKDFPEYLPYLEKKFKKV